MISPKQECALLELAKGSTLETARVAAGYKSIATVHRIAQSREGKLYLANISKEVRADAIYCIKERLAELRTIAKMNVFAKPSIAVKAVSEINKIERRLK